MKRTCSRDATQLTAAQEQILAELDESYVAARSHWRYARNLLTCLRTTLECFMSNPKEYEDGDLLIALIPKPSPRRTDV
jgi:hypothetical protein